MSNTHNAQLDIKEIKISTISSWDYFIEKLEDTITDDFIKKLSSNVLFEKDGYQYLDDKFYKNIKDDIFSLFLEYYSQDSLDDIELRKVALFSSIKNIFTLESIVKQIEQDSDIIKQREESVKTARKRLKELEELEKEDEFIFLRFEYDYERSNTIINNGGDYIINDKLLTKTIINHCQKSIEESFNLLSEMDDKLNNLIDKGHKIFIKEIPSEPNINLDLLLESRKGNKIKKEMYKKTYK